MRRNHRTLLATSAAFLLTFSAAAQVASDLMGRITDPSGAAVAGASVTAVEMRTGASFQSVTGKDGYFDFSSLLSGRYRLQVAASGFKPLNREGLTLAVGQTLGVDLALAVGDASETVTVTGDLPLLQNQTSDIQFTVPQRHIEAIPLNSRNFIQLTTLSPGVELPPGTLLPRINGGRPRTNEYLYDGISALQPEPGQVVFFPIIDSIQEFTVESDNVSAEFGRFNGGVVNLSTRSGTNTLHCSLFEYLRNEDFNARNYFAPANQRKPEYRRNLYGGTIGLPILKDRLFFSATTKALSSLLASLAFPLCRRWLSATATSMASPRSTTPRPRAWSTVVTSVRRSRAMPSRPLPSTPQP